MAKELWLIRHGETVWNALGKISGWHDVELSEAGAEMARALRPHLQSLAFDHVWSSDLQRARRTAQLAYGQPREDQRLRELDFGELEGLVWMDIPQEQQKAVLDFSEHCAPGGETISQFEARVFEFLEEIPDGTHLLFVHGGLIRLVLRQVNADQFVPPTSIAVVDWTAKRLVDLKRAPHPQLLV